MMNDVFLAALAFDVRNLAPDITSFATADPGGADGNGANSWGGAFKTPGGQRYHVAREISAIWSEKEPTTLGRMWLGMALNRFYPFSTQDHIAKELRGLAGSAISAIPPE